ncbi:MAG: carboxypeptidase regulatory-like domain-containing protein [Xanthobacteraceae bacterium]|nr:carboxypeptidase regulatory-like domain-containing protein [Xanthobacteraceae bacterium]
MRCTGLSSTIGSICALFLLTAPCSTHAEPLEMALVGTVAPAPDGRMEGVLVSARRQGSNITITVVSDAQGHYGFPAARLNPGQYSLSIRAIGYELAAPETAEVVSEQTATHDLLLHPAQDLAAQLTNGEWIASVPGTDAQRVTLLNCTGCHTLERIVRSNHTADEFMAVLERMHGYVNQSIPSHPQLRRADRLMEEQSDQRVDVQRALAEYLATINLSATSKWSYPLRTLPRPSGHATHVIITEYDLPRETIEPHDVIVDADGIVWYSSFGEPNLGRLDPRSGRVTEYSLPELKPGFPTGSLGLRTDAAGNLWLGMMYQGGIARFDKQTEAFRIWSLPVAANIDAAQVNMVSPQSSHVDGKVWTQNNGFAGVHRLDIASGSIETFRPFRQAPKGEPHNIYDVIPDSHNNAYFTDFRQEHIGRIDAKTGEVTLFATPTPRSAPRRGMMDAQDRLWFGEFRGNRIGMFDTKTGGFTEWLAPTPWTAPYDVTLDKNGEAWSGSMSTDRVLRLDTKTGRFVEYLLPRETNIRRVFVDDRTSPVTFWVGSNHGASIVKVEPLD